MPKLSLQQRLVDALVATGRTTPVASRSREVHHTAGRKFFLAFASGQAKAPPSPPTCGEYERCLFFSLGSVFKGYAFLVSGPSDGGVQARAG